MDIKIKIPSSISLELSDRALTEDVIDKSTSGEFMDLLGSNSYIGVADHEHGGQRVHQFLGIDCDDVKYVSALLSPSHLFLSAAIELYQISEQKRLVTFPTCGKKSNNPNLILLNFESGYTHECFTDFLKTRGSSIIVLVSALENFMNQQIPNDYIHHWTAKGENHTWNHKQMENSASFKMKLVEILPLATNKEDLWESCSEELSLINELYRHRKEFVHLKTKSKEDWKRYSDAFDHMVIFELHDAIDAVIKVMNYVSDDFVEIE